MNPPIQKDAPLRPRSSAPEPDPLQVELEASGLVHADIVKVGVLRRALPIAVAALGSAAILWGIYRESPGLPVLFLFYPIGWALAFASAHRNRRPDEDPSEGG